MQGSGKQWRSQLLDPSFIFTARLVISGQGLPEPLVATASVVNGVVGEVLFNLPDGANRVVEVQGLGLDGKLASPFSVVRGVASTPGDTAIEVSWSTTPAADVILALRAAGSSLETSVDRLVLQGFINRKAGSLPGTTNGYEIGTGTVSGKIAGLLKGQEAKVFLDDPVSTAATTDSAGNYTVTGVLPSASLSFRVENPFYVASQSALPALGAGGTARKDVALGGNFLPATLEGACGVSDAVVRFRDLPIRFLAIMPTGSRASSWGFSAVHAEAVEAALAAFEGNFPSTLQFELTKMYDDDDGLSNALRRADIYLYWLENGTKSWCGGTNTIGCATWTTVLCGTTGPLQSKVQVAINYSGGERIPRPRGLRLGTDLAERREFFVSHVHTRGGASFHDHELNRPGGTNAVECLAGSPVRDRHWGGAKTPAGRQPTTVCHWPTTATPGEP